VVVVDKDRAAGIVLPAAITADDAKEREGRGEGLWLLAPVGPLHACVAPAMRDGAGPPPAYLGGSAMAGDLARGWGRRRGWGSPRGGRRGLAGARERGSSVGKRERGASGRERSVRSQTWKPGGEELESCVVCGPTRHRYRKNRVTLALKTLG
jgi:hypothetical protein